MSGLITLVLSINTVPSDQPIDNISSLSPKISTLIKYSPLGIPVVFQLKEVELFGISNISSGQSHQVLVE